jgi:DNA polymerase-1
MRRDGPNIQNIPIRTEEGTRIRDAFKSHEEPLFNMDYAELEERILQTTGGDDAVKRGNF